MVLVKDIKGVETKLADETEECEQLMKKYAAQIKKSIDVKHEAKHIGQAEADEKTN